MKALPSVYTLLSALAIGAGASGCIRPIANASTESDQKSAAQVTQATTVKPERTTVNRSCRLPASVAAFEQTPLHAKISGYVQEPKVDIGDIVRKDQLLAELWIPELVEELKQKGSLVLQAQAEVKQAEAAERAAAAAVATAAAKIDEAAAATKKADAEFAKWKAQLDRDEKLAAERAIQQKVVEETRNQWRAADSARDEAAAKVRSATANLAESEAKLAKAQADVATANAKQAVAEDEQRRVQALADYAKIRAPFDGVVTQRNVDTGHFIPVGGSTKPLFVVIRVDPVRIFLDVPEKDVTSIENGQRASARIESLGELVEGTVTRSAWAVDPTTRTMRVEIDVANPLGKLRPGMYALANIVLEEHSNVLTIPTAAVIKQGDKSFCVTVKDGKATRIPIRTGIADGATIEVITGLSGDESVVSANAAALTEGQHVQATSATK